MSADTRSPKVRQLLVELELEAKKSAAEYLDAIRKLSPETIELVQSATNVLDVLDTCAAELERYGFGAVLTNLVDRWQKRIQVLQFAHGTRMPEFQIGFLYAQFVREALKRAALSVS